mgnify:CR=1 FL=1
MRLCLHDQVVVENGMIQKFKVTVLDRSTGHQIWWFGDFAVLVRRKFPRNQCGGVGPSGVAPLRLLSGTNITADFAQDGRTCVIHRCCPTEELHRALWGDSDFNGATLPGKHEVLARALW